MPPRPKRRLLLRQLEERLLFTAVPFVVPEIDPTALDSGLDALDFGASEAAGASTDEAAETSDSKQSDAGEHLTRREVVVVDAAVADYEQLLEGLSAGDGTRELSVLVLDPEMDAIEQIGDFLADYAELDAIHLISHGDDASLRLGDESLTIDNLSGYAGAIASWSDSLSDDADLLLYGCDVAGSEAGPDAGRRACHTDRCRYRGQ